ncbi:MAG: hypothetical protein FLDDKLPJ_02884 [Phycisphaerae bacterium]|nr:hypothetical protein [Phycisphaerae bacterium]
MPVLRHREHAAEVSHRRHRGHERHETFVRIRLDFADFVGRQSALRVADVRIERERERMFDVELKLVDLEGGEAVDQALQRLDRRDFPARDVVQQAAQGERRMIPDDAARRRIGKHPEHLSKCLQSEETPRRRTPDQFHAIGRDAQFVALRMRDPGGGFRDVQRRPGRSTRVLAAKSSRAARNDAGKDSINLTAHTIVRARFRRRQSRRPPAAPRLRLDDRRRRRQP